MALRSTVSRGWVLALLLPTLALSPPASATETLHAEVDFNAPPSGCVVPGAFDSHTAGATLGVSCGDNTSVGAATARVDHGQVGAASSATDVTQGVATFAYASWQDDSFVITGAPGQTGTTPVSLNFILEGGFGGFGAPTSNTVVIVHVGIFGASFDAFIQHMDTGDSCQNGPGSPVDFCGPFNHSESLGTVFTTPVMNLPINTPFEVDYVLQVDSDALGRGASTDGDFAHTLGFATGGPVLNFTEPGFTVNAGSYIIDNAYVAAVDEPAASMLLAVGLGGLVPWLHRRRPLSARAS